MTTVQHETTHEWLQMQMDGELPTLYRGQLAQHLESCETCRREAERLTAVRRLLDEGKVPVVEGFTQRVVEGLPGAAWESRRPGAWIAAAAALILLISGSALLLSLAGGSASLGPIGAVASMLERAVLAGAGLLTASWRGLGLALADLWSTSPAGGVALGVLVVALNVLLWRGVRGRGQAARTRVDVSDRPRR